MLKLVLNPQLWKLIAADAKKEGISPAAFIHRRLKEMYNLA